jgi:proton-translocating NADH-quinone oxidoreductase chain M
MFVIIGIWGSRERKLNAAFRFFIYTLFGSVFFLVVIIYLVYSFNTLNLFEIYVFVTFNYFTQCFFWFFFFIAFAVKMPLYPLHTRLPEAHAEAPTVGSILLAGILLKLGPYGLIRFANFLFPAGFTFFRPLIFCLCLLSIYYTVLTALRQLDIKKLVAYSSIGHMALILIGLSINSIESFIGAVLLLIAHGFVPAGLSLLIGFIYDRYKTRVVLYYNGLIRINPKIGFFFFFFLLGNIAFPGTLNFISELFIIIGLYQTNWYITFLVVLSSIFVLSYNLFIFARIFLYTENISYIYYTKDLIVREYIAVIILLFPIYFFGFFYKKLIFFFFKVSLLMNFSVYYVM